MNIDMDTTNRSMYQSKAGVESYKETKLQAPEVSVFTRYRNAFHHKHVLDIGCGAGRTTYHLADFADHYVGIDYSGEMIACCKQVYPDLEFHECDARDMSRFSDKQFDFILFSYNGIDYVSHQDRLKILSEIRRLLNDNGMFVFSTHNRNFKNIIMKPRFKFSFNPLQLLAEVRSYIKKRSNQRKLLPLQIDDDEYAILNESGNNFGLLTYYISKTSEYKQLKAAGFDVIAAYALDGRSLTDEDDATDSCWIYYVTKQTG